MKTKLQRAASLLGRKGGPKGGKSKSEAKSAAARVNGAKGGRKPRNTYISECGNWKMTYIGKDEP